MKILLLMQIHNYKDAIKIIEQELERGFKGYLLNSNKGYYEYLKEYCEIIIKTD